MDFIQEGFTQAVTLLINRDPATYSAINATLRASGMAMAASLVLGVPLGYLTHCSPGMGPSVIWGLFSAYPALPSARRF
jgi:ABC-type tungstate transport system substrate-binding protein